MKSEDEDVISSQGFWEGIVQEDLPPCKNDIIGI